MEKMIKSELGWGIVVILFLGLLQSGECIRCFECLSRLGPGETDPCWSGDGSILRRVRCIGPSVCATYRHESLSTGSLPHFYVTRGCQSLRYGATCEDIFHHLRNSGEILPGRHVCSTCSTDLCNSSSITKLSSFVAFIILIVVTIR